MTESEWISSEDPAAMLAFATQRDVVDGNLCIEGVSGRKLRQVMYATIVREMAGNWEVAAYPGDPALWLDGWVKGLRGHDCEQAEYARLAVLLREIIGNPFRPVAPLWQICSHCRGRGYVGRARDECPACFTPGSADWWGSGKIMVVSWLTPTVLQMAKAAYEEWGGGTCGRCGGTGCPLPDCERNHRARGCPKCPDCHGTGRINDGALDPDRLTILADALEEAGCTEAAILTHLRGYETCSTCGGVGRGVFGKGGAGGQICPGCKLTTVRDGKHVGCGFIDLRSPHVRDCWALDLILGRE